ncbi:MAG: peptidase S9 [Saprospiraceae bacterium]|nr:MAG: peptidase S9 [Saprospiraceae bacterium]
MQKQITYLLFTVLILFAACTNQPESVEEAHQPKQYTIEQFMGNTSVGGGSFSADGSKILLTSNQSGIFNAYNVPVAGGDLSPLTTSTGSSIFAVSYFPEDDRFLYRMDDNGNELFHLFVQNMDGTSKELTPDSMARASFYGWAHDGKSFFYGYSKRDPQYLDVYEMNTDTYESKMLYQMSGAYNFAGISNNKKYMALTESITTNDSDLYLYDFETKELKKISQNRAAHNVADFSTDNEYLYYLTDDGSEFSYLARYQIASGQHEKILEKEWDISYAYFSHGGKYQVVGTNADGKTVLDLMEVSSGKAIQFPTFEQGDITSVSISRSEELISFYVGSSASPSNLYVYEVAGGDHRQLTNTLNPEIDPTDLVTAEVVRYPSFDNLPIPAIYYKPHTASTKNKVPALVWVHGGPGGQSRQNYHPLIQYLANHGYAILAVNNRGSSGYGKTFYKMDDRHHGESDLQDCVMGKEWLAKQDYINAEEIGIIGGSYGGYMVMAALTREPEAFEVGVNIFGVTNWLRTLKSIPPWWASFKDALYEEMGDPYQDSVRLYNISPLFHADKIVKPVMVLQGAKDPRVLQVESDEIVAAARENNVPVDYVLFEDEGHGFVKKENQIEAYGKILEFVDKYLKKGAPVMD